MKIMRLLVTALCLSAVSLTLYAANFTTYLSPSRGFTEVTDASGLIADAAYCYILTSAEKADLIVGVGRYEGKPDWASEETKALRYAEVNADPVCDLSNFFTLEKSGSYVGFRNVVYSSDLFQTHDNAGYMYVNTFTDKTLDEWSFLTPTRVNGYWLFESGKYPISSGNWACGYLGPWNNVVQDGEPIALNRRNTSGDEAGHYRLFRIAKDELMALHLYSSVLTAENSFTEVTAPADMVADNRYCYLITAAENKGLYVGVGRYEAKPDWAGEDTKALRYRPAELNPLLDLSNFFTIERDGQYVGLRNLYYASSLFQTHDNAGYMYVLTYTEPTMSDWCALTPTWQNGYWLFESGKYPISSDNWACGYLGPWNKVVQEGEPIALNRRNTLGDEAGHYRLFRIAKTDLVAKRNEMLQAVSAIAPLNATRRIANPSFETGDETGWTLIGKEDGNNEFTTRDYGMTGKDGNYLMNAYQWWAASLSVKQTVTQLPAGVYELTGVVASWEGRTVTLSGNEVKTSATGAGEGTGVPLAMTLNIRSDGKLVITAGSTTDWWSEGDHAANDPMCFFKLDDVRLRCKGAFLDALALPLPNDNTTRLIPNQWYYYDVNYHTDYVLQGQLDGLVYSTEADKVVENVTATAAGRNMTLPAGHVFFKTTSSDATLSLVPGRSLQKGTFTAVALNVDGLPNKIATLDLNPDGPGADGTKKISRYLASKDYDFIGCSEDFNYNGSLMESLNDRYWCGTIRNTLSVSGLDYLDLIQGKIHVETDGLNLIWKFSKIGATGESWTRWWDTESTDGNQYVEKGYRHYDVQLDGGPVIDVFILHMDAGDTNATWSRESQWRQLAEAVNGCDHNRAKLIIGDTNSRWTREDIISNFNNLLSADFTMSDVWVEFFRDGVYPTTAMNNLTDATDPENYTNYEIVDKIIYINPKAPNTTQLVPQSFRIEQDYTYGNVDGTDDTTPLGDHRPVVVTFAYTQAGALQPVSVSLTDDAADNSETLAALDGAQANVTLSGRTLYKDGAWNTLCLPFDLALAGSCLEGATVKELDTEGTYDGSQRTGLDGTLLRLYFKDATAIEAGKPYLVKWTEGEDLVNPTFSEVTLSAASPAPVAFTGGTFVGYYDAFGITAADDNIYYLTADNMLTRTGKDRTLRACRTYFTLEEEFSAVKGNVISFGEGTATAVRLSGTNATNNANTLYDLSGRRVGRTPAAGIYVRDGKKVVVR